MLAGTTLPQVNGYELARFMRSKAELRNVPVLLLSGAFETVDEAQLKSSGANGVIEKPVEPIAVISRVKELLGIKSERQTGTPAAGRLVTPAVAKPDHRPAAPVTAPATEKQGADDFDSLESAFDTLDQQLAGRVPSAPTARRNPSPPLGRAASGDPRSPGKRPIERSG